MQYILIALIILAFAAKPLMRILNIPRATISRAKVVHKREYTGTGGHVGKYSLQHHYFITFMYMSGNNWKNKEFSVSKKIYNSIAPNEEGILRHTNTAYRGFEKFKK